MAAPGFTDLPPSYNEATALASQEQQQSQRDWKGLEAHYSPPPPTVPPPTAPPPTDSSSISIVSPPYPYSVPSSGGTVPLGFTSPSGVQSPTTTYSASQQPNLPNPLYPYTSSGHPVASFPDYSGNPAATTTTSPGSQSFPQHYQAPAVVAPYTMRRKQQKRLCFALLIVGGIIVIFNVILFTVIITY